MKEMEEKELREYEIGFLVKDEATAKEVVEKAGQYGTVTTQGPVKRLSFAYPIKKEISGFFSFLRLETESKSITQLEKDFEVAPMLLRFLVLRLEAKKAGSETQEAKPRRVMRPAPRPEAAQGGVLTNEALEKKIEEILQ